MKHARIDRHFIKSGIDNETVFLSYIFITSQEADVLTKALSKLGFESCVGKLGMIDIYSPVWRGVLENQIPNLWYWLLIPIIPQSMGLIIIKLNCWDWLIDVN